MIQKQAIMHNLAGYAKNNPDGTVALRLQGDKDRIDKTLDAASGGNPAVLDQQQRQRRACRDRSRFEDVYGLWMDVADPQHHQPLRSRFHAAAGQHEDFARRGQGRLDRISLRARSRATISAKFNKRLEDEGD